MACPHCKRDVADDATACLHCGASIDHDASDARTLPLFSVSTRKFIVLSVCTFGLYDIFWSHQHWVRLRDASGKNLSPLWRAVFMPIWNFSLFGRIRDAAAARNIPVRWSAGVLAALYLIMGLLWRLPDPWWLIGFGSAFVLVPVQRTAREINRHDAGDDAAQQNATYGAANTATIVIGGIILLLAVLGTCFPAEGVA